MAPPFWVVSRADAKVFLLGALQGPGDLVWLPRLDDMLGRPGARFVVVGLLHLVGEESVIALLRDQGHTVDAVVL